MERNKNPSFIKKMERGKKKIVCDEKQRILPTCNLQQIKEAYDRSSLPGQGTLWLQTCVSFASPSHFFPPCKGAG